MGGRCRFTDMPPRRGLLTRDFARRTASRAVRHNDADVASTRPAKCFTGPMRLLVAIGILALMFGLTLVVWVATDSRLWKALTALALIAALAYLGLELRLDYGSP